MDYTTNDRNKIEYFEFYQSKSLPIHFSPLWMDALCGKEHWKVILAKNPDNGIEAVFVYHQKYYLGKPAILMPPLTSFNGIWYNYPNGCKTHSKISFETKAIKKILEQLPTQYLFMQQFHPSIQNWLPFRWEGFKQTTRYTYVLDLSKGVERIWDNFKGNVRRNVRKAEKEYKVIEINDFDTFIGPLENSYRLRNKPLPFKKDDLKKVENLCSQTNQRKIFVTINEKGQHLAGIYLVFDKLSSYYLVGYFHPEYKDYAALTLCLWEGIQQMSKLVDNFDFEGSIIPEIEFYFRAFGGILTPHYKIYKTKNQLVNQLALSKNPEIFD